MKFILSFVILLFIQPAFSKTRFGAGIMIGSPTGITGKLLRSGKPPIDAGLSFGNDFEFYSTYLFPQKKRLHLESLKLKWYWGLGAKLENVDKKNDDDKIYIGPRASAGINHYYKKYSLESFADIAGNVFIIPDSELDLDLYIGVRYFF